MTTDIPASAREFERWYFERSPTWPAYLQVLGSNALMSYHFLDQPQENQSERTIEMARKDLLRFAVEFGGWMECDSGKSR